MEQFLLDVYIVAMDKYFARTQCAAITNGCTSVIIIDSHQILTREKVEQFLLLNNWSINFGEWICDKHESYVIN